jgi:hypothetical protein
MQINVVALFLFLCRLIVYLVLILDSIAFLVITVQLIHIDHFKASIRCGKFGILVFCGYCIITKLDFD